MIIFTKIHLLEDSLISLSYPVKWDEYRVMVGKGVSVYSQAKARGFECLNDQSMIEFIDFLDKIQELKTGYTLNIFSNQTVGNTIVRYLEEIFLLRDSCTNGRTGEIDSSLFALMIKIREANVRSGISI